MLLFQKDGWKYEVQHPSRVVRNFPDIEPFVTLWNEKRGQRKFPAWRDFDFFDFKGWWGWIVVEDVLATAPLRICFRLWGTLVTDLYGADLTHISADRLAEEFYWDEDVLMRERVMETGEIGIAAGPVAWAEKQIPCYRYFLFPMADDQEAVDKFLILVRPLQAPTT